jgi:acetolactate synthase-1/2/3 large subunit
MDQPIGSETMNPTAAEALVTTLADQGIDLMFALPGVQNDHLFDALHGVQDRMRLIHTRHEQGAAYMALGAAMATGKPAAYCVVPGPGVLNSTAALCTAYAVNAPVLCLTGQLATPMIGKQFGMLHEIPDQLGILKTLTKWAERVASPGAAAPLAAEAMRQMRSGRPRPVALECPLDVWPQRTPFAHLPVAAAPPPVIDEAAIEAAARLLVGAECPMILVGGGAQDASVEVRALAEALQAPVVTNRLGRGVLDSRHPLSLHGETGYRLWPKVDVAIGVGTRMQTPLQMWGTDSRIKIIQLDIDPAEIGRIKAPDVALIGDAAPLLAALVEAVRRHRHTPPSRQTVLDALKAESAAHLAQFDPQKGYLDAIRAELPDDGIVVDEVTQIGHVAKLLFPVYQPRTFLTPGYQGTLGWGVATAIGAAAACPDRQVVSITGDGGFMFTVQELATAAQFNIPLAIVLMNDGGYGNVRRTQIEDFGNRTLCTDLANPDFLKLADAFGISGYRAKSPEELRTHLRRAFERRETAIVDCPVGALPSPWPTLRYKRIRH